MTSQVFYRKWRPQTLAEVTGQEQVTRTLRNALETGRVSHAYLFCGPRGTGKTSTGRILAKAVNCLNNGKGEPCNTCQMCQAITDGSALDVIEIDAASNRKIDDIRDLRERIKFAPNQARYKVYIIDEVHALTNDASNALLKTLEEPPSHAILILATTEPHMLLTTILSRCQRFDFRRLSHDAVISKLEHICQEEGISIEPQGLRLIARSVSGSLRDAENLLQQLVVYYGNQIEVHQAEDMLGVTADFRVKELVEHMVSKDTAAGLATINGVVSDGVDLMQFSRGLTEYLRNLLLAKSGAGGSLDLGSEDLAEVNKLAAGMSMDQILNALKLFGQVDFRSSDYSSLPLEVAFVECILAREKPAPPAKEAGAAKPIARSRSAPATTAPRAPARAETAPVKPPAGPGHDTAPVEPVEATARAEPDRAEPDQAEPSVPFPEGSLEYIRAHWNDFVSTLRGVGSSGNLDAFLRSACEPVAVEDDTLVLAFYHSFHKDKIEDPKYRRMVEQKLGERFGSPNKVRCELQPKKTQRPTEGHLVKAAQQMGGRITGVVENPNLTGGEDE